MWLDLKILLRLFFLKFIYQKVHILKRTSLKNKFWLEQNAIFFRFLKSRKLSIYLVYPFRWPLHRLRKKSFYIFLFLRDTGSKEIKNWNFIYTYVSYVVASRCNTSQDFFSCITCKKQSSSMYVTFHGDWCAKMAPIFLDFKKNFVKNSCFV